jgi:2-methylcitrate dehydratase PrpD
MDDTLARRLATFAAACRADHVPSEVASSVRSRVFDILGISVAATALDTSRAVAAFVADQGGTPEAGVIGSEEKRPAAWAAFANGVLAHSLDYDDTHLPSVLHPSAAVVPAGLAVGERFGSDGTALVDAVAAGVETTIRVGMAGFDPSTRQSTFFEHGQHATSICGTIGAAVTAGLLSGLDRDGIVDAIGIAVSMASGVIEGNRTGGTVKRMHCGWAAHAGVVAAALATAGITGPPTALEGRFGLFEAFLHGTFNAGAVTDGLGERWELPGVFFKPYPANHFTHAAADAAIELRSRGLDPATVDRVRVGVASATVRTIGQPIEVKRRPVTGYQAQFSGPYVVAAALLGGGGLGLSLDDFTDELAVDPQRRALMDRIHIEGDEGCDAIYPYQFPAVVEVTTTDGSTMSSEVLVNRGGEERPLTAHELALKFRSNVAGHLDPTVVDEVIDLCDNLDRSVPAAALVSAINEGFIRS